MEVIQYAKEVISSKEHKCDFCGAIIIKGDKYLSSTYKNDGKIYHWKIHYRCEYLAKKLKMYDNAYEGVSADDFAESINCCYDDLLISMFTNGDRVKYKEVIEQIRHVRWANKLFYVYRYFTRLDKHSIQEYNQTT